MNHNHKKNTIAERQHEEYRQHKEFVALFRELEQIKKQRGDISARSHELISAQTRLHSLLHNAHEGIIIFLADGTIQQCNLKAQQLFGFRETELIASKIPHIIPCPQWAGENVATFIRHMVHEAADGHATITARHKDGSRLLLETTIGEISNEETVLFEHQNNHSTSQEEEQFQLNEENILICFFRDVTLQQQQLQELTQYQTALSLSNGVLHLTTALDITKANDLAQLYLDQSEKQLQQLNLSSLFVTEEDDPVTAEEINQQLANGSSWQQIVHYIYSISSSEWFRATIVQVNHGDDLQLLLILADITEDKKLLQQSNQQQQQLQEAAATLNSIIHAVPDALMLIDNKGVVEQVNNAYYAMFGYSHSATIGQHLQMLLQPKQIAWVLQAIAGANSALLLKLLESPHQFTANHKSGSQFQVELTFHRIELQHRTLFLCVAKQIAEVTDDSILPVESPLSLHEMIREQTRDLIKALDAAEDAREIAEKANRAKSDFLANMSHELRTPMHAILSFANFGLRKTNGEHAEKIAHYFNNIKLSGERLLHLLNNLLDLAKLESGNMELQYRNMYLDETVKVIINEFEATLQEKRLQIELHTPDDLDTLQGSYDSSRIAQVVNNLISNAIRYSPTDSKINISLEQKVANLGTFSLPYLHCTISDSGIGIPQAELDSIFDKFIQSSKTDSGAGGTGLGLAICKEIIEAHQGVIWAENRSEGGARLQFLIPVQPQK